MLNRALPDHRTPGSGAGCRQSEKGLPMPRRRWSVTPDQWFFLGFALLILGFLMVLVLQPGAVGRGGR
jgi:hypothetical protein